MSASNTQQLNENHGIAATGIQQPHTAVPPTFYNDKAGDNIPSETNRHAGTGVPPVNVARHVEQNKQNEVDVDHTAARIGRNAFPPTNEDVTTEPVTKDLHEARAVTGEHPSTSTGPEVVPQTGKQSSISTGPEVVHQTGNHPTTATGPNVEHQIGGNDNKVPSNSETHRSSDSSNDNKPSAGDKIKGNIEKIAGKITGNEAKVIKGDNIAHGRV